MPLVRVKYDPRAVGFVPPNEPNSMRWGDSSTRLNAFTKLMPGIVAKALHVSEVEDAHLTETDVEVETCEYADGDISSYGLEIIVWANHFPEREQELVERRLQIEEGVRGAIDGCFSNFENLKVYVWVLLAPASFGEFIIE